MVTIPGVTRGQVPPKLQYRGAKRKCVQTGSPTTRCSPILPNQQKVAGPAGHVAHLPPVTSTWNKIEPLLFSEVTLNWLG